MVLCPAHLVLVDGDASDMGSRDRGDGAEGASNTTATVQALHARLEADEGGDARLMGDLGRLPVLTRELGGEMEALQALIGRDQRRSVRVGRNLYHLSPAPLVEVSDERVEDILAMGARDVAKLVAVRQIHGRS